jgi:putative methionine-R-sulfoxide reductase with GAF domain
VTDEVVARLGTILDSTEMREVRAQHAAETVRAARGYRWVGIYDVGDAEIELIGHTGAHAPVDVRFSVEQGVSGEAVRTRETIVRGCETVVPILGAETGIVIGTLDVESDRGDASGDDDRRFLEACAQALMPLFE